MLADHGYQEFRNSDSAEKGLPHQCFVKRAFVTSAYDKRLGR